MANYGLPYGGVAPSVASPTSASAAESIQPHLSELQQAVLRYIRCKAGDGATDDEIERYLGMRHQTVSARRRELVLMGRVVDRGWTRRTRSGRKATVWYAK